MLPKLFFTHFKDTSFVIEDENKIIGFLCGFVSQSFPEEAYIHFVGVHPDWRKQEIGRSLYQEFCSSAKAKGCRKISAVTLPLNERSVAFHLKMGFRPKSAVHEINDISVFKDYDGAGEDRVLFEKEISAGSRMIQFSKLFPDWGSLPH